jgi:hypothetical protein
MVTVNGEVLLVIEATAKAKGINKGRLIEKIDELEKQRIIRPTVGGRLSRGAPPGKRDGPRGLHRAGEW